MKQVGFYHVFPFQEVEKDSSIVIWGMGEVGQHYLQQVIQTGYCNVEFAVDKNWSGCKNALVKVMPPIHVKRAPEHAKIVIANGNGAAAGEIRKQLTDWGIPEERILWCDMIVDESIVVSDQITSHGKNVKRTGFYHIFPFQSVEKGESIILWSMGEVGRNYAKQLQKTGFCQVEYAVDSKWSTVKNAPVPVKPPQAITKEREKRIVIANGSPSAADAIKKQLAEMGVEESRILWDDMIIQAELVTREAVKPQAAGVPYLYGSESELSRRPLTTYYVREINRNYDVVSLGIFHSCVLSLFGRDRNILYSIIGERIGCKEFAKIRLEAEKKIAEHKLSIRMSLEDIYALIAREIDIDPLKGCEMEVNVEAEFSVANPYMLEIYDMLKAAGKYIIFTEDSYLRKEYLEKILRSCGYTGFQQVFSSCDLLAKKSTGDMYQLIRNMLGKNKRYVQFGQHYNSDKIMAQKNGWGGIYYTGIHEYGNKHRASEMSEFIGAKYKETVNRRLHIDHRIYSTSYECGFIYGGVLVLGFSQWVSQYVKDRALDKVIFLSDDSNVFHSVFRILSKSIDSKCTYWSDEISLRFRASHDRHAFIENMLRKIPWERVSMTVQEYLMIMHLEWLISKLPSYRLTKFHLINENIQGTLEDIVFDYWNEILECFKKESEIAKEYIKSLIGESKNIAIIDVSGYGETGKNLRCVMEDWGINCQVDVLTMGTKHHILEDNEMNHSKLVKAYVFSKDHNRDLLTSHFYSESKKSNILMFDILYRSVIPKIRGFKEENGKIKFEFGHNPVENLEIKEEINRGIFDFCKDYINCLKEEDPARIAGWDAYMPFKKIGEFSEYLERYFGEYHVMDSVSDSWIRPSTKFGSRTIRELFELNQS